MTYVIEVLTLTLLGIVVTLLLGLLLGVLPGTATGLLVAFLFRHSAGGAHSNSPWRCGIITAVVYPLIALLAVRLSMLKEPYPDMLTAAAVLLGLAAVIILAPVDSPAAPIISPLRRKKLKRISVVIMLMLVVFLVVLRQSQWDYAGQIQICVALNIIWLSFMLSKQGHKFISLLDNIKI